MKYRKLFYAILCMMAVGAGFVSCVEDDEDENCTTCTDTDYENQVLILNQGSWQSIDASLCRYNRVSGAITTNLFSTKNGMSLGDTGQDMIFYNDQVYVTAAGSRTVYRIGRCGLMKATFHASSDVRSLAAKDGKLYVSCYGGIVLKLDAETLEKEAELKIADANLEGIAICGNTLYVAKTYTTEEGENGYDNYIYFDTLEAIDLATFQHVGSYQVALNPNYVMEMDGRVYVLGFGDYGMNGYSFGYLTPGENPTYTPVGTASKMAVYNHTVYYAYSEQDWSEWPNVSTVTTFGSYDATTGTLNTRSFLKDSEAATKLAGEAIYMLEVDPRNGDFYIAASDYVNHSIVYRFDREGNYITEFNTGGINAYEAVFM